MCFDVCRAFESDAGSRPLMAGAAVPNIVMTPWIARTVLDGRLRGNGTGAEIRRPRNVAARPSTDSEPANRRPGRRPQRTARRNYHPVPPGTGRTSASDGGGRTVAAGQGRVDGTAGRSCP